MSSSKADSTALSSGLVVDIDRHIVRAVLFDTVGAHGRFVSSVHCQSTVLPPVGDGFVAVRQAIEQLESDTGLNLLSESAVTTPRSGSDGVDFVALTGQPNDPIQVVLLPAGHSELLGMLVGAARRTPSSVEIFGRNVRTDDGILSGTLLEAEIRRLRPDVVIVLEGQNAQAEWATISGTLGGLAAEGLVGLAVMVARDQLQQQSAQTMGENADLRGIAPGDFDPIDIAAAIESELHGLHEQRFDPSRLVPSSRNVSYTNRIRAGDLVTTFLSRRREQSVLAVSIGDGVTIHAASPSSNLTVNRPDIDAHASIRTLLKFDSRQIAGWLPYPVLEEELYHWILNRSLRPYSKVTAKRDKLMEYAATTAAIRASWGAPEANPSRAHDVVIGGPALAEWDSPALALLCLLNAIQPKSESGVIEVHLDQDGLLYAAGAVGDVSPALAADVVERDLLVPLAAVIVAETEASEGASALSGEITVGSRPSESFSVAAGSVHRLDVPAGESAVVNLVCESSTAIGASEKGATVVLGEDVRVTGGILGVVIDARVTVDPAAGDLQSQSARISGWLSDLGETELNR